MNNQIVKKYYHLLTRNIFKKRVQFRVISIIVKDR